MLHRYLTALALAAVPSCVCTAPSAERFGDAVEPGLSFGRDEPKPVPDAYTVAHTWLSHHPGKCGVACFDAWFGCNDYDMCTRGDAEPDDLITCGSNTYVTCRAAREAKTGEDYGLDACHRICEDLQRPSSHGLFDWLWR
jgi:hypothetical protein